MTSDYHCPHCQRIRKRNGQKPAITAFCGCVGADVVMQRIPWGRADWTLTNRPLAEAMNLKESAVAAKRRELRKPRGTNGRKAKETIWRKIDPSKINPDLSAAENAKILGASEERIRQLMNQAIG